MKLASASIIPHHTKFPLKLGSVSLPDGPVGKLQKAINRDCAAGLPEDGYLGLHTLERMKKCYNGKTEISKEEYKKLTVGI